METIIAGKQRKVKHITQSTYKELLKDAGYEMNIFAYGPSGTGKSEIVDEYGEEEGLTVIPFSLATEMPEAMGGIPHVNNNIFMKLLHSIADKLYKALTKDDSKTNFIISLVKSVKDATETNDTTSYFTRLLDNRLAPLFKTKGKGYVLFFDELPQAPQEVMNCLYSICHPNPKKRHWCGHSLEFAQIVAAGNLNDGTDGTVYSNEPPTPLHNRFHIFVVEPSEKDTKKYLAEKWKNIPQVAKYLDVLLKEEIPPRDIDEILKTIALNKSNLWIASKIGDPLTNKLLSIKKNVETVDPAKVFNSCKEGYKLFNERGHIKWAGEWVDTEDRLIEIFRGLLSEEEIKAIVVKEEK